MTVGAVQPSTVDFHLPFSSNPVAPVTNWTDICTAPATADNSGSLITNPGAITRSAQNLFQIAGFGTTVQVRLKYLTAATPTTNPVVQFFGKDSLGSWQRLFEVG